MGETVEKVGASVQFNANRYKSVWRSFFLHLTTEVKKNVGNEFKWSSQLLAWQE